MSVLKNLIFHMCISHKGLSVVGTWNSRPQEGPGHVPYVPPPQTCEPSSESEVGRFRFDK